MRIRSWSIAILCLIALCLAQPLGLHFVSPAYAKKSEANKADPIGYGGPHLRLLPMMAPYHSSGGVMYQPLMIEVEVATGASGDPSLSEKGDIREKQACFILPLVHEKILQWLFTANLTAADFSGEQRDVLEKHLFDVVIGYVGKGFYTKLTLLNDDAPPLEPKSETLSKQCH
jgi:hypothetical protein